MNRHEVKGFIKTNVLQFSVQMVGLVVVIANLWIATQLAPLAKSLAVVQTQVQAIEEQHTEIRKEVITRDDLNLVTARIDKISARLDEIIGILIRK